MGLDLSQQLKQARLVQDEIERALGLPNQVEALISEVDAMIVKMQRIRFNLLATLQDFQLESKLKLGKGEDTILYDSLKDKK